MTISMYVKTEVKDFDTWKSVFDESTSVIEALGVIGSKVSLHFPS